MSTANAQEFFNKVVNDQAFRDQMTNLSSPADVLQAAQAAGYDFTADEMRSVLQSDKGVRDFTDDELDSLAGDTAGWVAAGGTAVGASVGAGAAAAACV